MGMGVPSQRGASSGRGHFPLRDAACFLDPDFAEGRYCEVIMKGPRTFTPSGWRTQIRKSVKDPRLLFPRRVQLRGINPYFLVRLLRWDPALLHLLLLERIPRSSCLGPVRLDLNRLLLLISYLWKVP